MRVTLASQVAIEARLLHAPDPGRPARLKAAGGVRLTGRVRGVDEGMRLPLMIEEISEGSGTLSPGSPVHVTLDDGYDQIAFYTTVSVVEDATTLLLRFPAAVQVQECRRDMRKPLDEAEGVQVHINDGQRANAFRVVDVSRKGLSFRFEAGELLLTTGTIFTAYLLAPGLIPYRADIEVSHVRCDPDHRGSKLAGVRLVKPPPDLLAWLSRAKEKVRPHAA